jgi:hypothetical protein
MPSREKGYAMIGPGGYVVLHTIRMRRRDCIAWLVEQQHGRYTWTELREFGWQCVRVVVSVDGPDA